MASILLITVIHIVGTQPRDRKAGLVRGMICCRLG
jgi:hypothetical protein